MLQVTKLHKKFDKLQLKYGNNILKSIYGAGKIDSPNIMFIFMNPTIRNVSSSPDWKGIRAPWLGTKQVWGMFNELGLLSDLIFKKINKYKVKEWNNEFCLEIYENLKNNNVYITNFAKCTQIDARPLNNRVFKEYLELMYEEIELINPQKIVAFGNQVSSILLSKPISVSKYLFDEKEILTIKKKFKVFPTFYPVGQGRRNQPKAIKRIKELF